MQEPVAPDTDPISVPWSVTDMVIGTVLVMGSFLVFILLFAPIISGNWLSRVELIWLAAVSEGALVYIVWRLTVKKHRVGWDALGFRRPRTRHNVILVVATLVGSLILTGVYSVIVTGLDIDILMPEPLPEELVGGSVSRRVLTAIAVAGFVPFVEEVFFRGFLFQGLASRYGLIWGAVFSSAIFAVSHLIIGTMIPIFIIGVLFAALYARTRSLWMPMSAHAAQNLFALTLSG